MEIELDDIPVMYVVSPDGPKGSGDAFKKLEQAINRQLKGRKFYGTMFNGEYRASVAIIDGDIPEKLGLPTWTIPGGKYFKEKLADWEKHISEIAHKCEEIIAKVNFDKARPVIEFYRSQKELYLFIPIK